MATTCSRCRWNRRAGHRSARRQRRPACRWASKLLPRRRRRPSRPRPIHSFARSRLDSGHRRSSPIRTVSSSARRPVGPTRSADTSTRQKLVGRPRGTARLAGRLCLRSVAADVFRQHRRRHRTSARRRDTHARRQRRRPLSDPAGPVVPVDSGRYPLAGRAVSCACAADSGARVTRRSLRAGLARRRFTVLRIFHQSRGGWNGTLTSEFTREALGADDNGQATTLDLRGYFPVFPRHAVVAARVAAAASWGDLVVRSSAGHRAAVRSFSDSTSDRRPSDCCAASRGCHRRKRAAVVNVDYRFPLLQIERGVGTWPAFARVLHGAVFVDAGHAWDGTFRRSEVTVSLGAELLARRGRWACAAPNVYGGWCLGVARPGLLSARSGGRSDSGLTWSGLHFNIRVNPRDSQC